MGNQQAQQKYPCNFTLGFFSISPQFVVTIKNNEIETNIDFVTRILKASTFPGFRLILKDIGDAPDIKAFKYLDDGKVEFLPYLSIMAHASSVHSISPVVLGSPTKMVSFSQKVEYTRTDLTSVLDIIDDSVWMIFFLILLIVSIFLSCGLRKDRNQSTLSKLISTFWSTIAASTNQTSITHGPRILLLCFSIFIFFLWAFFNGSVNTDLVVGKKPFQINEMEDVLQPEASEFQPKWRKRFHLHRSFENSDPDSVKGKIWRKAIANRIDEALISTENFSTLKEEMENRKFILFESENFIRVLSKFSCHWAPKEVDIRMSHGDAGEELLSFPLKFQNDSCYSLKREKIPKIFLDFFESGLIKMLTGPGNFFLNNGRNTIARFQCPVVKREAKAMELKQVSTENISNLLRLYFTCLCVCFVVFLAELSFKHFSMLRLRRKVHDQSVYDSPQVDSVE